MGLYKTMEGVGIVIGGQGDSIVIMLPEAKLQIKVSNETAAKMGLEMEILSFVEPEKLEEMRKELLG